MKVKKLQKAFISLAIINKLLLAVIFVPCIIYIYKKIMGTVVTRCWKCGEIVESGCPDNGAIILFCIVSLALGYFIGRNINLNK